MFLNFGDDLSLVEPQCHRFGNEWVDRFAQPELAFFFGEDFTALDHEVAAASLAFDYPVVDQGRIGLGDRLHIAVADADEETLAAINRLSNHASERINATLDDAVLAYLTRDRGDGSFFSSPVNSSANTISSGAQQ